LACYAIIYVTANLFGIYHQNLTYISQEDAFKNTIKFLNGRIQLEKEKQQQVSFNGYKLRVILDLSKEVIFKAYLKIFL
jgi:hypothetical protein